MPFNNNNNNKEKNATREPAGTAIELNALDYVLFFSSLLSLPFSLSLSLVPPPFPWACMSPGSTVPYRIK